MAKAQEKHDLVLMELKRREHDMLWDGRIKWVRMVTKVTENIVSVIVTPITIVSLIILLVIMVAIVFSPFMLRPTYDDLFVSFITSRCTRIGCDFLEVVPGWIESCNKWLLTPLWVALCMLKWLVHTMIDVCDCSLTGK